MDRDGRRRRTIERLLHSREPSIRLNTRLRVLGEDPDARSIRSLREEVRRSSRVRAILRPTSRPGARHPAGIYDKWLGLHWALAHLAELGYPAGDDALRPSVERAVEFWLRPQYFEEFVARTRSSTYARNDAVPLVDGRYRRCASQQGNALSYASSLGFADGACDRLVERLLHWQWPDGGWNCDRTPSADTSSFYETLTPMVGLATYGRLRGRRAATEAARRASEVFLRRRLFKRISNGAVIHPDFLRRHYPIYWRYDALAGLKALAPMGLVSDPRCGDALGQLRSTELPGGGWTANARWYDLPGERPRRGRDKVAWGALGVGRANEWVTVDALSVLHAADGGSASAD